MFLGFLAFYLVLILRMKTLPPSGKASEHSKPNMKSWIKKIGILSFCAQQKKNKVKNSYKFKQAAENWV